MTDRPSLRYGLTSDETDRPRRAALSVGPRLTGNSPEAIVGSSFQEEVVPMTHKMIQIMGGPALGRILR